MMMLGEDNENVRNLGVAKVLARRKQVAEERANNDDCSHALNSKLIRLLDVPTLNLEENAYLTTNRPILILPATTFSNCLKLQVWLLKQPFISSCIALFCCEVSLPSLYMLQFFRV